ncbi:unnamed protein product, partial [Ectocarpus sp. 4 AP-2014]
MSYSALSACSVKQSRANKSWELYTVTSLGNGFMGRHGSPGNLVFVSSIIPTARLLEHFSFKEKFPGTWKIQKFSELKSSPVHVLASSSFPRKTPDINLFALPSGFLRREGREEMTPPLFPPLGESG